MALVRRRQWRQRYVKFRGGSGFIWALTAFLLTYIGSVFTLWGIGASWWPWLLLFAEAPFILLNLLLSIEASYAMPVLLMEQEKSTREIVTLLREGRLSMKQILQEVKEVMDELDGEDADA
ncbi:MAG: DUF1003 domain-containing protein [Methylocella sp.]